MPLKCKKGETVPEAFQRIVKDPGRKPDKYGQIKVVNFKIDQ